MGFLVPRSKLTEYLLNPRGPVLLQSVWYRGEGEDTFRLVTAYPWREK
jgi:hypothetical protein